VPKKSGVIQLQCTNFPKKLSESSEDSEYSDDSDDSDDSDNSDDYNKSADIFPNYEIIRFLS
jgi:hypothetical protein